MRLTSDKLAVYAREVATTVKAKGIAVAEIDALLANKGSDEASIAAQRATIETLKISLAKSKDSDAKELASLADHFRQSLRMDYRWRRMGIRHRIRRT